MSHSYKMDMLKKSESGDTNRNADRAIIDICKDNGAVLLTALPDANENCWFFSTDKPLDVRPDFVEAFEVPRNV